MVTPLNKGWERGDVRKIKIEGGGDKGREVSVYHETAARREERSAWSWYEEFTLEWSKTFMTKRRKRNPK